MQASRRLYDQSIYSSIIKAVKFNESIIVYQVYGNGNGNGIKLVYPIPSLA